MSKIYAIVFIVNNLSIPVIFLHQADMDYHSCKNKDKNEAQKQIMACPWQKMTHYQQQHSQDEKCQAQVFQIILHTLLYIYVYMMMQRYILKSIFGIIWGKKQRIDALKI